MVELAELAFAVEKDKRVGRPRLATRIPVSRIGPMTVVCSRVELENIRRHIGMRFLVYDGDHTVGRHGDRTLVGTQILTVDILIGSRQHHSRIEIDIVDRQVVRNSLLGIALVDEYERIGRAVGRLETAGRHLVGRRPRVDQLHTRADKLREMPQPVIGRLCTETAIPWLFIGRVPLLQIDAGFATIAPNEVPVEIVLDPVDVEGIRNKPGGINGIHRNRLA